MTSKDRDSQSTGQNPDELVLEIGGRIFDVARTSEGGFVAKVRRDKDQSMAITPSEGEPSNILTFPQKPMSTDPEIVSHPSPLREGYEVALPAQPQSAGRKRRQGYFSRRDLLKGAATVLVTAGGYAAVGTLFRAVAPALGRAVEGFNNPIGLRPAEKTRAGVESRRNLELQLSSNRTADGAESEAKLATIKRKSIEAQIKFKEDFAKRIDKIHGNPTAGDSHRQEAARLQALLDK